MNDINSEIDKAYQVIEDYDKNFILSHRSFELNDIEIIRALRNCEIRTRLLNSIVMLEMLRPHPKEIYLSDEGV